MIDHHGVHPLLQRPLFSGPDAKLLRSVVLILLGMLTVLALPPVHFWPAAFVGLSGFFLFLDQAQTKWAAFIRGWLFGIGFFGAGLYWLTNAFLVNADKHGWLIPIAVPALAAAMGLYIGVTALLGHGLFRNQKSAGAIYGRLLLFALAWTVMEWVRGWLFTGFPWNLMGTVWSFSDEMIQPAAYVGAYGLSLLTVLCCLLPAVGFYRSGRSRLVAAVLLVVLPAGLYGVGALRLAQSEVTYHGGVTLRLVQPNIAQNTKWKHSHQKENFQRLLDMSWKIGPSGKRPSHIIWPETAVTAPINREPRLQRTIASVAPSAGAVLTGFPRMSPQGEKPFQIWNSFVAINEVGDTLATFDKFHLVPFGEYVPLRGVIPMPKITAGAVDFSPGPGARTVSFTGLPAFSPLICYEVIFPDQVIDPDNRPEWLLNITNDGWYGDSPGPYQHLASARMRSVEEGLPLVRVANTGISVITDPYGRIEAAIPYGVQDSIDVSLAHALDKPTLVARYRGVIWGTLALAFFVLGQLIITRRKYPHGA